MQGFKIYVEETSDADLTGIRFKLYDNDEAVVSNIGTLNFEYLVDPELYVGEHILSLTYYKEDMPELESTRQVFYTGNFTLPTLTLTITADVF